MKKVRKSTERGRVDYGWLQSWHTFSFGDYYAPQHKGFRTLRVINEDTVQPGEGFATHSHQDMEILTYVLEGALEHKDSLGNTSVISPGEMQRMSAGTGVTHSEYNHSKTDIVHFLQIWILTEKKGIPPGYEQKQFSEEERFNQLRLLASHDGRAGSVTVFQDVSVYDAVLTPEKSLSYALSANRHLWIHCISGQLEIDEVLLLAGDGLAVSDEEVICIKALQKASLLLFDLG